MSASGNIRRRLRQTLTIARRDFLATVFTPIFLLFLFAIGFRVGPQFFSSFDSDAIPQFAVTVVLCLTGLLATWACAVALGLNPGIAAGLLGATAAHLRDLAGKTS